jgi:hypothetical protein
MEIEMKAAIIFSIFIMVVVLGVDSRGAPMQTASSVLAGGDTIYCPGPYVCFTADDWAYYADVWQLYDDYALCYHFGELGHIAVGDTLREVFFNEHTEGDWRTLYDGISYVDTIRSMVFTISSGDTIQFWHDI